LKILQEIFEKIFKKIKKICFLLLKKRQI